MGTHRVYTLAHGVKTKGRLMTAALLLAVTGTGGLTPLLLQSSVFAAATYTVCASGCNFTTIQAAVNAAAAGDTISVGAGTFTDNGVNINKTLTLKGAQAGTSAVSRTHGAATETVLPGSTSYLGTFIVTAPNVVIDGFDFGPATDGVASGPIGVDLGNSAGATVQNSIFQHNQRGISLAGASNVTITRDQISYNNAFSPNNAGVWGDNVNTININNSELDGASNTAINLATGSLGITIAHNTFKANGNSAVIWQDSGLTFDSNTGSNFTGSGLYITGTSYVSVTNNTFTTGPSSAVTFSDGSGTKSSVSAVVGNTFSGFLNGVNAYYLSDVVSVHNNNLAGNTNGVTDSNGSPQANATGNWWGATTGPTDTVSGDGSSPDTNPLGMGDVALGAVKYDAWCTNVNCVADTTAPKAPKLKDPCDGSTVKSRNFNFVWNSVTDPSGVTYEWQSSTTKKFTTVLVDHAGLTSTTLASPNTPNGTYYWRVRAIDGAGNASGWSDVWKVTVQVKALKAPKLDAPDNKSTVKTSSFDFKWDKVDNPNDGGVTYEWQSSLANTTNPNGSLQTVLASHTGLTSTKLSSPNTPNGTYYWQVRAVDAWGTPGPWSSVWKVTVNAK